MTRLREISAVIGTILLLAGFLFCRRERGINRPPGTLREQNRDSALRL